MKIICVGRNYADHAKELKNELPTDPVLFLKPKTAVLLPHKPLYYPEFTDDLHYECELVIRICKNGKFIQEKFARKYYDAITVGLDFTARDVQNRQKEKGLPWEIAKAFDGSAAVGAFRMLDEEQTTDDIDFRLDRNGATVQRGNSSDMIYTVNKVIEYASRFFTFNIGDLLFTGTPAGVGPVSVHDKLEGYLYDEKVLDVDVR